MRNCLIYISLLLSFILKAQEQETLKEYKRYYFPGTSVLSSEGYLYNGKPEGYWKAFYDNGLLKSEGNRKNFLLDSTWKFYNDRGILVQEINYLNDKKNGLKKVFEPDSGKIQSEEIFFNDIREGLSKYYMINGSIRYVPYVKGKENGLGKEVNKDGVIVSLITYKNGILQREEKINRTDKAGKRQGIWKTFFENEKLKTEARYVNDKLDGYYKEYNEKGDLIKTEKYVDGVLQVNPVELVKMDLKKQFHPNGKVKSVGTARQGVLEGYTRYYDSTGVLINAEQYKNGFRTAEGLYDEKGFQQGYWKEFYVTGELRGEGNYENGRKVGLWKFYHTNGQLEQIGKYNKKGKPDGDWKWYYESGNILREEFFDNGRPEGEMKEYSDSGRVITKGIFVDGEKDGFWFLQDGDEREEGNYKNGLKDGIWKFYYSNGKISKTGKYLEGVENGKFTFYYDNGRTMQEGDFIMGLKDGNWKKFDRDGNPVSVITFLNDIEIKIDGDKIPDQ